MVEAWYNRGCSWYEVGELENAIADLTRAIELAPTNGLYYGQRALVYHFNDQPGLAEADQERCDELRFGAELGRVRLRVATIQAADAYNFTLTPTLSLKGEGIFCSLNPLGEGIFPCPVSLLELGDHLIGQAAHGGHHHLAGNR